MAGIKTKYKIIGLASLAVIGGLTIPKLMSYIPKPASVTARVPEAVHIARMHINQGDPGDYQLTANPGDSGGCVKLLTLPWQAGGSLNYANGGARTKPGSLVAKYAGGCVSIEREDSYDTMKQKMVAFANGDTQNGAPFVMIMGDGLPYFAYGLNGMMPGRFKAIGALGFSNGEDGCFLPPEAKRDPQKARGMTVAASKLDGDWNICVKWASDNGVPINSNTKEFHRDALNFIDTGSFTEADERFVSNAPEDRIEVNHGLATGKTVQVRPDGVTTWTPGDDYIVHKRGGVVKVASTRDYESQMPALIIGDSQWMAAHKQFVVGLLKAADRGANAIRTNDEAFHAMTLAHAEIFGINGKGQPQERTPEYWAKYFPGFIETDNAGNQVLLGGSEVINLREQATFFGLTPGSLNIFKGVYTTFGGYGHTFYPTDFPNVLPYDEVMDLSYLKEALSGVTLTAQTNTKFAEAAPITEAISKTGFHVEFDSGKATIKPESFEMLNDIANRAGMTNLRIRIVGFTDNAGSDTVNVPLSRARAQAVADFLNRLAPSTFPKGRMQVSGMGSATPIAENATDTGRRQNRRVEITLGN